MLPPASETVPSRNWPLSAWASPLTGFGFSIDRRVICFASLGFEDLADTDWGRNNLLKDGAERRWRVC